jgi:D-proline reductase (dithiol) PrdB
MMWSVRRLFNRLTARLLTRYPTLAEGFLRRHQPPESEGIPWTPLRKPLSECTVALVTTAGVHLKGQKPFDMSDPDGDPSFREIPGNTPLDRKSVV